MKRTRLACDFCGKTQDVVAKLIMGPRDIGICDECTRLAMDIVEGKAEPISEEGAARTEPKQ